jgi:flagellar biogenesis protein FliO
VTKAKVNTIIVIGLIWSLPAFASVALKQVQVQNGKNVNLIFDKKIEKRQIQVDYINEIIQLSLRDVSIYPAKMTPTSEGDIKKIFAYQYSPKVVRCRFTVKGKAEDYKNRLQIYPDGKVIRFKLINQISEIQESKEVEIDEKQLVDRVMQASQPIAPVALVPLEKPQEAPMKVERAPLATGKPLPSVSSAFAKMGGVLVILGLLALVVRKLKKSAPVQDQERTGWIGKIKHLATQTLSKDGKGIQVLSTQYLGPKKSIVVVSISDRILVLGVTQESINLITQFSDKAEFMESDDVDEFTQFLTSEKAKPVAVVNEASVPSSVAGARSRIRNRLEGLKPL